MSLSTLLIMRHAKSSWANSAQSDHERPLNGRGRKAAKLVGETLRARRCAPDLIWSSDATRTRETVSYAFGGDHHVQALFFETLYHASANTVLSFCEQRGEPAVSRLMLVGHNPGFSDLVHYFVPQFISRSGSGSIAMPFSMPTGACVVLNRARPDTDWLLPQAWRLQDFILPKDLHA